MEQAPPETPVLRVVRGTPDDQELAALVTVLVARSTRGAARGPAPTGWAAYWRLLGRTPSPGPGAWTAAARAG